MVSLHNGDTWAAAPAAPLSDATAKEEKPDLCDQPLVPISGL